MKKEKEEEESEREQEEGSEEEGEEDDDENGDGMRRPRRRQRINTNDFSVSNLSLESRSLTRAMGTATGLLHRQRAEQAAWQHVNCNHLIDFYMLMPVSEAMGNHDRHSTR